MTGYTRSLATFVAFLLIFQFTVVLIADLERSFWGDESHYVETINYFGERFSLDRLRDYEEMSTPLPFILYALWGRLFGFDLYILRLLSLLIALVTYLLFHRLLFTATQKTWLSFWASVFLVVHPYMVGLSIFVYTDMPAMLCMITACLAVIRKKPFWLWLSLAGALLCRQYFVFFTLGVTIFYLIRWMALQNRRESVFFLTSVLSHVPVLLLFWLWQGFTPVNGMKLLYMDYAFTFHPSFLTLYISLLFIYMIPIVICRWRTFYKDRVLLFASFVLCWLYWLFPVAPAGPSRDVGLTTVGLFHRAVKNLSDGIAVDQVIFFIGFCLGLPLLLMFIKSAYALIRYREWTLSLMLDIIIILFFIVMPFSYLCWEKYFIPVIPVLILRMLLPVEDSKNVLYS